MLHPESGQPTVTPGGARGYCPDMEDLERWYTLMQDLPGMIRFAMVAASIATVIVIACLVTIAVQLGRVVTAIDESGRRIPPGRHRPTQCPSRPANPPPTGRGDPGSPDPAGPTTAPAGHSTSSNPVLGFLSSGSHSCSFGAPQAQAVAIDGPGHLAENLERGEAVSERRGAGRPAWSSGRSRWRRATASGTANGSVQRASRPGACARSRLRTRAARSKGAL